MRASNPKGKVLRRRRRLFASERRRDSIAAPPGIIDIAPDASAPVIRVIAYGPNSCEERHIATPAELRTVSAPVRWIDVVGLGDARVLEALRDMFGIHPLAMEDVAHQHQRPKVETYGDSVFIVVHVPDTNAGMSFEQLSMFLGPGFVLTFQEGESDCFNPVRERIRGVNSRIRSQGADYLAYSLIDSAIDHYFPIIDSVADRLDMMEDQVVGKFSEDTLPNLLSTKRNLLGLRRYVRPMRDVVTHMLDESLPLISADTRVYLRDCLDHTVQLIDLIEIQRELTMSLVDLYLSVVNQRMNEVMKVLTIIATIFMPLSFISGVYGMNFRVMPELEWRWGYPVALLVMLAIAGGLLSFFHRRGWLTSEKTPESIGGASIPPVNGGDTR